MTITNSEILYPFAEDESGNLVCIDDVDRENRHDHQYCCPQCGGLMVPYLGDVNAHCFAHKSYKCNKETYIHLVAKKILQERMEKGDLVVRIPRENVCDVHCPLQEAGGCRETAVGVDIRNLAKLYDTTKVETRAEIGGGLFIPDVTLSDSTGKRQDIYLEVCNTSPCSQKKLDRCSNIIEILVKNDRDLSNLRDCPIGEMKHKGDQVCKANFYNFKATEVPLSRMSGQDFRCRKVVEDNLGPVQYWKYCYWNERKTTCLPVDENDADKHLADTLFEITVKFPPGYRFDKGTYMSNLAADLFPSTRRCNRCAHQVYSKPWCNARDDEFVKAGIRDNMIAVSCPLYENRLFDVFGQSEPTTMSIWQGNADK